MKKIKVERSKRFSLAGFKIKVMDVIINIKNGKFRNETVLSIKPKVKYRDGIRILHTDVFVNVEDLAKILQYCQESENNKFLIIFSSNFECNTVGILGLFALLMELRKVKKNNNKGHRLKVIISCLFRNKINNTFLIENVYDIIDARKTINFNNYSIKIDIKLSS